MFDRVVIGGTFDVLHKGHKNFIETAFRVGKVVDIGITSDTFAKSLSNKVLPQNISPYEKRLDDIKTFVTGVLDKKVGQDVRFLTIKEWSGDAITNKEYQAIIVTSETKSNASRINEQRIKKGLLPLVTVECPFVLAEDGKPITSSRIRAGIIDRDGKVQSSSRKTKSVIRRNFLTIIRESGGAYGYQIRKEYEKRFGKKLSLRLTYYHLRKGREEGLFKIKEVVKHEGGFSWGTHTERVYYEPVQD